MHRTTFSILVLFLATPGCAQPGKSEPTVASTPLQRGNASSGETSITSGPTSNVDLPRFPSMSPDGGTIVFSWRGDLWKCPSSGGHATRLTSHPGDDLLSAWSRDGTRIAFTSDRNGFSNIYIMNADGSEIREVTNTDRACTLSGFGVDDGGNEVVTYSSSLEGDLFRSPRPYMTSVDGGDLVRLHDAFGFQPAVHAEGRLVAFTRGGARSTRRHYRGAAALDLWTFNRNDESFKRLTTWTGNDMSPKWAGGSDLLFLSDRESNCVNLYRMDANKGGKRARRLTNFSQNDIQSFDVADDGSIAVLHVWDRLYTLALDAPGAEPMALDIRASEDESDRFELIEIDEKAAEAALSPDGKVMAYVAYGEVYVRNIEDKSPTQRVTQTHAREKHIAWSPDGLKLYFVSDSDGTDSIYAATVALTRGEVKEDFDKAVNPPEDEPEESEEAKTAEKDEDDSNPSKQDSKKEESGEETDGTTDDDEAESDKSDDKNKKKRKKKKKDLPKELQADRWRDAIRFDINPVMQTEHNDRRPQPSLDGKSLSFRRSRGDLMILDIETGEARTLVAGWDTGIGWRWSPDSRHIAYAQSDMNFNRDIWIVPADGSESAVNITRHPNADNSPRWSADGRILAFLSDRVNDEMDVWMVYLDKDLESYTPKELETYYKDAKKAAKKRKPLEVEDPNKTEDDGDADEDDETDEDEDENGDDDDESDGDDDDDDDDDEEEEEKEPVEFSLDDAYLRLSRVTSLSGSEGSLALTPGGDRYIFTATIGERGLYSVQWDGDERKRLGGAVSVRQVSLTGGKVVIISDGKAGTVAPDGDKIEYVDISDKILVDLEKQSSQKFREAARILGEQFYHPTMKGLDWPALTEKYHELAKRARTADEFNDVANRFLGELNGSHLGVFAQGEDADLEQPQGRLGTVHKRIADGFEIVEVIPQSPADTGPMALKVGDVITAIDTVAFTPTDTLESRLAGRIGKETLLTIRRDFGDGEPKTLDVLMTPISWREQRQFNYRALRRRRADQVAEWSDGRIGYIHIQSMGQSALDVFERDLFAAAEGKKGLIIDVRDNGGGWTTDRLLASIMVQQHAYTIPRGADPSNSGYYPQGRLFIQRYTLPINMMCNENSYSNAEIISHAFKTLKRGTLVGQETFGAVISTGGTQLIDGTFVRLPFRGWYLLDGADMEDRGAVPHIIVEQTPESEARGDDLQLRAAVKDLLKRL